jgi:ribosomal protein S27AE
LFGKVEIMVTTVSDFCPQCGLTDFEVRIDKQVFLECLKCSFKKSYPPPYPPNWEDQKMTTEELVETTRAYGLAMFKIMESGICPFCQIKLRSEERRVEIMEDDGLKFPEENIKCPKCGRNSGWASFVKLMEVFNPVREFLKNHPKFRIETEGGYEVYRKKAWKISFVADHKLDIYFDIEAFEPVWMKADFDPVSLSAPLPCE